MKPKVKSASQQITVCCKCGQRHAPGQYCRDARQSGRIKDLLSQVMHQPARARARIVGKRSDEPDLAAGARHFDRAGR